MKSIGQAYEDRTNFPERQLRYSEGRSACHRGPERKREIHADQGAYGTREARFRRGRWEKGVSYAYFNRMWEELDPKDTVSHAVNMYGLGLDAPRKKVNKFLSMLQFSETDLSKFIGNLSGGQKARSR